VGGWDDVAVLLRSAVGPGGEGVVGAAGALVAGLDRVVEPVQGVVGERGRLGDPVEVEGQPGGGGGEAEVDLLWINDDRGGRGEPVGVGDGERDPIAGVAAEVVPGGRDRESSVLDAGLRD